MKKIVAKKMFIFISVISFVIILTNCSSTIKEGDFEFSHSLLTPTYVDLVRYSGNDAIVVVPARVGNYKVWTIKSGAFKDLPNLTEVTFLSDFPFDFNKNAFVNCPKLKRINASKKPFQGAFKDCPNIKIQ
jgi:hypothetical protein